MNSIKQICYWQTVWLVIGTNSDYIIPTLINSIADKTIQESNQCKLVRFEIDETIWEV